MMKYILVADESGVRLRPVIGTPVKCSTVEDARQYAAATGGVIVQENIGAKPKED